MSIMKLLKKLANDADPDSLSRRFNRKRFALFESLISSRPRPLTILDVGGEQLFWEMMGFKTGNDIQIVLLNFTRKKVERSIGEKLPNFKYVVGDARNMGEFKDKEFEAVFSNSVIEHVGGYHEQCKMANEIKRVGKSYFLQTPNKFFPIEPHHLVPFFQFFPLQLKVFILRHFETGGHKKIQDKKKAEEVARNIRLLTKRELLDLFPGGTIYKEKFFGLTKSFIIYGGWDAT